ncbi:MAG: response regulator transcription factor [Variovorax sp.]
MSESATPGHFAVAPRRRRPNDASPIRVIVVDDHAILRRALKDLLSAEAAFQVVGECANGREALDLVRSVPCDVLMLDLSMPGGGGLEVLASLRARVPDTAILVFSAHTPAQYAKKLYKQGVHGYLHKSCEPAEVLAALHCVASGRRYVDQTIAEALGASGLQAHECLSKREFQILLQLASGRKRADIAAELNLSLQTVAVYRASIVRKLGLSTNSELTYFAVKNGLLQ